MLLEPRKALNKAFLKIKPNRTGIELFKTNLMLLLDSSKENESEEFHKNLISDFLKNTYYSPTYFINTKGRNDLVVHTGKDSKSSVGVIIEAKSPSNKAEMISEKSLNSKALQELVLYFLRERILHKNLEIKNLVATNLNQWFIFDGQLFDKLFAQNKGFVKQFQEFEEGKLSGATTDFFYKEIAKPYLETVLDKLDYTFFNLASYDNVLRNEDKQDDKKLIVLYKLLSPEHLLKLSFANDSNSLDKNFYNELLHLIGLTETKEGGKKLIQRPKKGERHAGSLLENVITQLDSLDKLSRLQNLKQYGDTNEERLFTVGLELCITWVNRILFLKLLEAQLISYHKGDKSYAFLNKDSLHDYDNLNALFFMVLAKKPEERNDRVKALFAKVPYLNSSLFEPTELEHDTLFISGLEDSIALPFLSGTVIKDGNGKKQKGEQPALGYFFDFLDAYDFASEGSEDIQEDNKTLINASVLGLIFEKINGYKDGSFYTPSFITMYMCKETIRRAVVQKFNEAKGWECTEFDQLYNKIEDSKEANAIINSLKICDPAVGSGHFLVSALNEMISIKHDLRLLTDREGKRLKEYQIDIVNDELIVTDEDGIPFTYNPTNKESQRLQETLFHEKQTIIENCLFGVDINPNSVKICRLRLWIELLKNAYYRGKNIEYRGKNIEGTTPLVGEERTTPPVGQERTTGTFGEERTTGTFGQEITTPPVKQERTTGTFGQERTTPPVGHPSKGGELETLPNIDINIKCGNSLIARFGLDADLKKALKQSKWNIESYKLAVDTYRNAESKEQKKDMERLIADIKGNFRSEIATNDPKKIKLEKQKGELFNYTQQVGLFERSKKEQTAWNKKVNTLSADVKKLETEIEEIKSNKIYENAFEWRFEFPEVLNDAGDFVGFDVVIGNPPYIDSRQNLENEKKIWKENYESAKYGKTNTYEIFNELAVNILKTNGKVSFIIPMVWLTLDACKESRKEIFSNNKINKIVYTKSPVFEDANVDTVVFIIEKYIKSNEDNIFTIIRFNEDFKEVLMEFNVNQNDLENKFQIQLELNDILNNINSKEFIKPITEVLEIFNGIATGPNKENYFSKTQLNENYKPLLMGNDVHKYFHDKSSIWINYDREKLHRARNEEIFLKQEKILMQRIRNLNLKDRIVATIDYEKHYTFNSVNNILLKNEAYDIKFVLGVLNSKLINYLFKKISNNTNITSQDFSKIPFIDNTRIENQLKQIFITKVDQILALKQENPKADTSVLEREIDELVYALYGLSEEEIGIVEGS